jgi:putative intracellular protease/amidase
VISGHGELGDTGRKTGWFLSEVSHPLAVLDAAGYDIDFVSPAGGKAPMDPKSHDMEDSENRAFLESEHWRARVDNTRRPDQVNASDYDAVFFAGGHGTMWDFPENQGLAELTAGIHERGGIVGAVCHGPSALVNVKTDGNYLIKGRKVTGFSNEEEHAVGLDDVVPFLLESKLTERGGDYRAAEKFQAHVVIDGRLVTGQNPASAKGVGQAMLKLLEKRSAAA